VPRFHSASTVNQSSADTPRAPAREERLTLRQHLAYASGGLLDNFGVGGLKNLANPVFNVVMGVNPALVGALVAISRLWDAFADPFMGSISDNARTRWGRRRPFIFAGAIASGLTLPLLFIAPSTLGGPALFAWLLGASLLFYSAFTVFAVPYYGLGYELTQGHHERTRLQAGRTICAAASGLATQWIYPLVQSGVMGDPITSTRWVGVGLGVVLGATAMIPAIFLREPAAATRRLPPPIPLRVALGASLRSPLLRLLLAVVALMVVGLNLVNSLGFYVNVYHVHGGDARAAAWLVGWGGTAYSVTVLATTPLISQLSRRIGKRRALTLCLVCGLAGTLSKWFLYTPEHPWWQVWVNVLLAPGMAGLWLFIDSMVADICDHDELATGQRQAALYGAVYAWVRKTGLALSVFFSGVMLVIIGFDASLGGAQSPATMLAMRLLFTLVPVAAIIASLVLLARYPLDEARMGEIRAALDRRAPSP
jgi:GPH family glycoside/pentoside/hexuronide:cation symporter